MIQIYDIKLENDILSENITNIPLNKFFIFNKENNNNNYIESIIKNIIRKNLVRLGYNYKYFYIIYSFRDNIDNVNYVNNKNELLLPKYSIFFNFLDNKHNNIIINNNIKIKNTFLTFSLDKNITIGYNNDTNLNNLKNLNIYIDIKCFTDKTIFNYLDINNYIAKNITNVDCNIEFCSIQKKNMERIKLDVNNYNNIHDYLINYNSEKKYLYIEQELPYIENTIISKYNSDDYIKEQNYIDNIPYLSLPNYCNSYKINNIDENIYNNLNKLFNKNKNSIYKLSNNNNVYNTFFFNLYKQFCINNNIIFNDNDKIIVSCNYHTFNFKKYNFILPINKDNKNNKNNIFLDCKINSNTKKTIYNTIFIAKKNINYIYYISNNYNKLLYENISNILFDDEEIIDGNNLSYNNIDYLYITILDINNKDALKFYNEYCINIDNHEFTTNENNYNNITLECMDDKILELYINLNNDIDETDNELKITNKNKLESNNINELQDKIYKLIKDSCNSNIKKIFENYSSIILHNKNNTININDINDINDIITCNNYLSQDICENILMIIKNNPPYLSLLNIKISIFKNIFKNIILELEKNNIIKKNKKINIIDCYINSYNITTNIIKKSLKEDELNIIIYLNNIDNNYDTIFIGDYIKNNTGCMVIQSYINNLYLLNDSKTYKYVLIYKVKIYN